MNKILISTFVLTAVLLAGSFVQAAQPKVTGQVCPSFNTNSKAGLKNPHAIEFGNGVFGIVPGPQVNVPKHATRNNITDTPSTVDYTAIVEGACEDGGEAN